MKFFLGPEVIDTIIIGDGVGNGEVIIEDTTITGRVLVRGGGEDSIKIIGDSSIESINEELFFNGEL